MGPIHVTGFLCGALGAFALDIQKPHVALVENSTLHAKIASMQNEVQAVESQHKASEAIRPSLAPKSDKKFFGKDYPDDLRPTIDAAPKWSYPYPKVQSDTKYDADYVKDENSDGGHWKAQMDYDEIKMKYVKQQGVVRTAALREGLEKDEANKAAQIKDKVWLRKSADEADAAKAAEEAEEENKEWEAAATDEQKKEWEAAKKAGKSKEVFDAEQKVERAEDHLKDCQKAVDDAKAELVKVQAADAAKEAENQKNKDAAVVDAKGKQASTADAAKSKQAIAADKKAKAAASQKEADAAKAAADKEEADEKITKRTFEQEQDKLKRLATDLEKAEQRLREYRGEPAHDSALHAETTRSGAARFSAVFLLVSCLVAVAA